MKIATGSYASNSGNRHKRDLHGAQRDERHAAAKTPAGQFGATSPPSREALERAVVAGVCPWCGHGPYTVLPGHTNKAHGVSAAELRALLGWSTSRAVSSPEFSARKRADFLALHPTPEDRVDLAARGHASHPPDWHRELGVGNTERNRAANAERDSEIVERWSSGATLGEIAEEFGVHPNTANKILRRLGVDTADAKQRAAVKRDQRETLARATAARARNCEDGAAALLAEWAATDGSWDAMVALAHSRGVQRKTLQARLSRLGAAVPDGRVASPLRIRPRPELRGKPNARRRLTPTLVAEIQARYSGGGVTQRALAEEYDVGQSIISRAITGVYAGEKG